METLVYTSSEVAKLLRVRPDLIGQMLEAGEIPAYREGKCWKIPKTLLQAYIENRAMSEAKARRKLNEED